MHEDPEFSVVKPLPQFSVYQAGKRNCVAEIVSQSKTKLCRTRHNFTPFYMTMQSKF